MTKKQINKNDLHTEYGIFSNSFFLMKKMHKYCPFILYLMLLGVITNSLMQYLWSFIGKYVIDIVEMQSKSPDKNISPLLHILIVTTGIELISMILNCIADNKKWYYFILLRNNLITERISKVLSLNYQSLENSDILDMHQKACNATGSNEDGVEGMMRMIYHICVQFVIMIVTVSTVTVLDPVLIIILAAVSAAQFLFSRYTGKKDKKEVWDVLAPSWRKINYMERAVQDFDYAKDIRLFNMKDWLSAKHHDILMKKQERMLHSQNLWIKNSVFSHLMTIISGAAIYCILIFNVLDLNMSIGNFTLFLGLAGTFSAALTSFLNSIGSYKTCSMQTDDFRTFMNLKTEEGDDFLPLPETDNYTFEFRNVSFKYAGAEDYALKNLNLTLEAGKKLAVVGLNGAGKTTFIKLLLRLYDVSDGEILLNGINVKRFRLADYYKLFSPVFQDVETFAFSISENISMKSSENTDKTLAEKCAVEAGLSDKLKGLTNGIDTEMLKIIHEDGIELSGGEKQKLALARALYKNAPIIVLDEPTAALDALAEYKLYKEFNDIIGNKSAVYISHRLSSTRFCDSIAMFKSGEMIEYGTHDELIAQKGPYSEMFELQAQYYKEGETKSSC